MAETFRYLLGFMAPVPKNVILTFDWQGAGLKLVVTGLKVEGSGLLVIAE